MKITIEQLENFSPEVTLSINNLLIQLNPESKMLNDEDVKKIIEEPSNRLFVAKDTEINKIIGMVLVAVFSAPSGRKALLEDLVVDESYRGKGIGEKLANAVINQARKEDVARLDLTSNFKRIRANELYQQIGFKKRDTNVYRLEL